MRIVTAFIFLSVLSGCNKKDRTSASFGSESDRQAKHSANPYIFTSIDHFKIVADQNPKEPAFSIVVNGLTADDSSDNIEGLTSLDGSEDMHLMTVTLAKNVAQECQESYDEFKKSQGKLEFVIYSDIVHCSTRNSSKA